MENRNSKAGSTVLDGRYTLREKVGNGSFGHIYTAISKEDNSVVAIKLEKRLPNSIITLSREAKILTELRGEPGFPTVYDYGKDNNYNYLVLDLLGHDLEKLFKSCNYKFSLKTSLLVFEQMLTRIESLHQKGYIHRDIKPENFCISKGSNGELHLIDFGLARSYKDFNGKHIPCTQKRGIVGTARYASINNHLGREQSRRDDLEAIGYTMIYLMKGQLPWQNLKALDKKEKYEMIANQKVTIPTSVLCKDLPEEFLTYMDYVKKLDFVETPDYKYLKGLFRALFLRSGFDYDFKYDWVKLKKKNDDLGSLEKIPLKGYNIESGKIEKVQSKERIGFENKLMQKPKENGIMSPAERLGQRQPRPSIELSPYKLIVSRELLDSNNEIPKIAGDIRHFVSKTYGNINGAKEDNQTRTMLLLSENSPRNISTSSEHSSKMINLSKTKLDDDEIPIEITLGASPSLKIKQTMPIKTKTKNSYYVNTLQGIMQVRGPREELRKKTFGRTHSARPSLSSSEETSSKKMGPVKLKKSTVKREDRKVEDDGDLNESIEEWGEHTKRNYMIDQRAFVTNTKNM